MLSSVRAPAPASLINIVPVVVLGGGGPDPDTRSDSVSLLHRSIFMSRPAYLHLHKILSAKLGLNS